MPGGLDTLALRCSQVPPNGDIACNIFEPHSAISDNTAIAAAVIAVASLFVAAVTAFTAYQALREQRGALAGERWASIYHTIIVEPTLQMVTAFLDSIRPLLADNEEMLARARRENHGVTDVDEAVGRSLRTFKASSTAFQERMLVNINAWGDPALSAPVGGALLEIQDKIGTALDTYRGNHSGQPTPSAVLEQCLAQIVGQVVRFDIGDPQLRREVRTDGAKNGQHGRTIGKRLKNALEVFRD